MYMHRNHKHLTSSTTRVSFAQSYPFSRILSRMSLSTVSPLPLPVEAELVANNDMTVNIVCGSDGFGVCVCVGVHMCLY